MLQSNDVLIEKKLLIHYIATTVLDYWRFRLIKASLQSYQIAPRATKTSVKKIC